MPRKARSVGSSPKSKPTHTPLGPRQIAALEEVKAHVRGEIELNAYEIKVPDEVDVADLRHRLGLSQARFAREFGVDLKALQAWEQGRRHPDRTARILLAVIAREPEAVKRALAA